MKEILGNDTDVISIPIKSTTYETALTDFSSTNESKQLHIY